MNDLIERQAAIDEVSRWRGYLDDDMINRIQIGMKRLPAAQTDLSSYSDKLWKTAYERGKADAQPQRKPGKWFRVRYAQEYKYQCDQCGRFHRAMYDFCPSCGADMRGGEHDGQT